NEDIVKTGNPDLLIYPAVDFSAAWRKSIYVSNGKQTDLLSISELSPDSAYTDALNALTKSLSHCSFEPDAPNFTPRISGCIREMENSKEPTVALSIIKRDTYKSVAREYYDFKLRDGKGKLISTYTGENKDPLPSFAGAPLDVEIGPSMEDFAFKVWFTLNPEQRVSVACVSLDGTSSVINRNDKN
ncbi:MAG: IMP cyclohydrolase, partial [Candidatus Paceibacterota bacterium]